MFDIGLFELLVVGGVGLVVIGPEKLPGALRTGALWIGRIKRSILETRREIEQQIGADDIRRELRNEEIMASLEKLREARTQLEKDIKAHTTGAALEHHDGDESDEHIQAPHAHAEHNDREYHPPSSSHDDRADALKPVDSKAAPSPGSTEDSDHSSDSGSADKATGDIPNHTKEAGSTPTKS
ncbi:MAG TPA: Sec-independent protein translocase protein TatB [Marinagarivorans sp.]